MLSGMAGAFCAGDDVGDDYLYTPPPPLRPRHEDDNDFDNVDIRANTVDLGCLHSTFHLPLTGA